MPPERGKSEHLRASLETYDTLTEHKAVSIGDEEVVLETVTMFFKHVATQQTTVPKTEWSRLKQQFYCNVVLLRFDTEHRSNHSKYNTQ